MWRRYVLWAVGTGLVLAQPCRLSTSSPLRLVGVLLVGSEGAGLSAEALALADARVRIRMAPGVDSLNVSAAAAIALHRLQEEEQG